MASGELQIPNTTIHEEHDNVLPYSTCGIVVKGFGRGSKALGIPTGTFLYVHLIENKQIKDD